jgi:hypothetical protein
VKNNAFGGKDNVGTDIGDPAARVMSVKTNLHANLQQSANVCSSLKDLHKSASCSRTYLRGFCSSYSVHWIDGILLSCIDHGIG